MRILHTLSKFYPYVGGVENYVYYLSKELVGLGHQVKVICANEPRSGKEESIEGIKVNRLSYLFKIANTNITLALLWRLAKEDFDILHSHLPDPWNATISSFICAMKKRPFVITYHNDIVGTGINKYTAQAFNLLFLPLVLGLAKKIIITHKEYLDYSPYLKRYKKKIIAIPLGVDLNLLNAAAKKKKDMRVHFLGLLDKFHGYKGLDYLIRAMSLVKDKIPNAKLVVGGDGELKSDYQELARSLRLEEDVEFIGFVSQEGLSHFYAQADVFALPSLSSSQEGFGIVLLEAMAASRPVVTTNIVGAAERIKEYNAGRVVAPRDERALAQAIIEILDDQQLANKIGSNGRRLVEEHYDWRILAKRFLELYENFRNHPYL